MELNPKVFISYAWTNKIYKKEVLDFAKQLCAKGVDVILDQWYLRPGQDAFFFMEQSINASDKVLVLCNREYMEKANKREGGVGNETAIITPEIYGHYNQTKFIPIIMDSLEYVPRYLKSRVSIDFTPANRKEGLDSILEAIYEQPRDKKPDIGDPPEWINFDPAITVDSELDGQKVIMNKDGKRIECDVLFTFDCEDTMRIYIGYTDNSFDLLGRKNIYVSSYNPFSLYNKLENITDERELAMVGDVIKRIINEFRE